MDLFSTPDAPTLKESVIIEAETCSGFRCSSQHEIKIYSIYSLMHVPGFIMNNSLVHVVRKKKRFNFLCNLSSKCTTFYFSWLHLSHVGYWIMLINIFRLHFTSFCIWSGYIAPFSQSKSILMVKIVIYVHIKAHHGCKMGCEQQFTLTFERVQGGLQKNWEKKLLNLIL